MENLSPSNDTLENVDDAHKGVMCVRSTFFKTNDFPPSTFKLNPWTPLTLKKVASFYIPDGGGQIFPPKHVFCDFSPTALNFLTVIVSIFKLGL